MKNVKIKIKYEPEADVLAWEISKQPIDYAKETGNMIVHFSKKNEPVLVEILQASEFLTQSNSLIKQGHLAGHAQTV